MNKGRRNEITRLKHKKRCKVYGIKPEEHYCYKAQGKPCSCMFCQAKGKYKRVEFKTLTKEEVEAGRPKDAYDYLL